MRYYTHIATSTVGAIGVAAIANMDVTPLFYAGVALGSITPDIDEPKSKIGRKLPIISHLVKFFFNHRGVTHTLIASILVFILLLYFWNVFPLEFGIGFSVGYLLHIMGDMFSVSGVPLFMPFTKKRIKIPFYRTGGVREHLIFVVSLLFLLSYFGVVQLGSFFT